RPRRSSTARRRRRPGLPDPRCRWTAALARRSTPPAHQGRRGTRCGSRTGLPSSSTGSLRAARSSAAGRPAEVRVLPIPCCCCSSSVQPQSGVGARLGIPSSLFVTRPVGDSCEYGALGGQMSDCFRLHLCRLRGRRGSCQRYPLLQDTISLQQRGRCLLFLRIDCISCDLPRIPVSIGITLSRQSVTRSNIGPCCCYRLHC